MKFMIGIEAIGNSYTKETMLDIPNYTGVEAMVYDNEISIETSEFDAYFESVSMEFDITARNLETFYQETEVTGAESDEEKKKNVDEKKNKWYKRLWESICNMFRAIGKWFSNAWTWVASKFKKGGKKDVAQAAKEEVKTKAEAVEKVEEKMEKKGGLTPEEIETYTEQIIKEDVTKSQMAKKMFSNQEVKEMAKEVAEQIIKNAEPAKEQVATAATPASPNTPAGEKLVPKANPTYRFSYWLFNDELIKNVESNKKIFMTTKMSSIYEDLKRNSNLVHSNAIAVIHIVENVASLMSLVLGINYNVMKNHYDKINEYYKLKDVTQEGLDKANTYILEFDKEISDIFKEKSDLFKMTRKEIEIISRNGKISTSELENKLTSTSEFKITESISERIVQISSYITNISKLISTNVDSMLAKLKSGQALDFAGLIRHEEDTKLVILALKKVIVSVKRLGTNAIKIVGKSNTTRISRNSRKIQDAQRRAI